MSNGRILAKTILIHVGDAHRIDEEPLILAEHFLEDFHTTDKRRLCDQAVLCDTRCLPPD